MCPHARARARANTHTHTPQQTTKNAARAEKARKVFPRPVAGALKPIVRGQTVRYHTKSKLGRGFTLEELKEAGVPAKLCDLLLVRRESKSSSGEKDAKDDSNEPDLVDALASTAAATATAHEGNKCALVDCGFGAAAEGTLLPSRPWDCSWR